MSQSAVIRAVQEGVIAQIQSRDLALKIFANVPPREQRPYMTYDGYSADRDSFKEREGWNGTLQLTAWGSGAGVDITESVDAMDRAIVALTNSPPLGRLTVSGYTVTMIDCIGFSAPERDYQADTARLTADFRLILKET